MQTPLGNDETLVVAIVSVITAREVPLEVARVVEHSNHFDVPLDDPIEHDVARVTDPAIFRA